MISFDAKEFTALAKEVGEIGRKVSNLRPALTQLLPEVVDDLGRNIRTQGRNIKEPFEPVHSNTLRQRGPGAPLLVTGGLARSLESSAKMRRRLTKTLLVVGPTDKRVYIHHFGSKKRNIPARTLILMSDRMVDRAEKVIAKHVDEVLHGR